MTKFIVCFFVSMMFSSLYAQKADYYCPFIKSYQFNPGEIDKSSHTPSNINTVPVSRDNQALPSDYNCIEVWVKTEQNTYAVYSPVERTGSSPCPSSRRLIDSEDVYTFEKLFILNPVSGKVQLFGNCKHTRVQR